MHFCEQDGFHSLKSTLFLLLSFLDAKHMRKKLGKNSTKSPTIPQIKPFWLNMHSHSRRANLRTSPNLYFQGATLQNSSKDAKWAPPRFFPTFKDDILFPLITYCPLPHLPLLAHQFPLLVPTKKAFRTSGKWNNEEETVISSTVFQYPTGTFSSSPLPLCPNYSDQNDKWKEKLQLEYQLL